MIKGRFQILKGYQDNHLTIGFGSYGQVKLAKDITNGEVVAVKIKKIAKNEIMMHYGLAHPKIIKLLDVHIDSERQITYMMLEYAEGGTLYDKLTMQTLTKNEVKKYFRDICQGLSYLHNQNIMHRDIKPENILLTKNNEAKLCDFGFAAILGERKTLCGTYEYMSPQMIQNRPYDYKIDIWAIGILLFQLIAGHAPFRGDKPEEVLQQMKTKIYFCQRFDPEDIVMIKMILRVTPHKRPNIDEILDQPYFKFEDKDGQLTSRSTTISEETKHKNTNLQYLSESCNPKKMGELQQLLKQQSKESQREQQQYKQSYPPFYVPKQTQKIGVGVALTNCNTDREMKGHSPLDSKSNTTSMGFPSYFPTYHPKTMSHPLPTNKTFNALSGKPSDPSKPTLFNPTKTNQGFPGFGRFS